MSAVKVRLILAADLLLLLCVDGLQIQEEVTCSSCGGGVRLSSPELLVVGAESGWIRTLDGFHLLPSSADTPVWVYLPWGCSAQEQLVPRFRDVLQTGPPV